MSRLERFFQRSAAERRWIFRAAYQLFAARGILILRGTAALREQPSLPAPGRAATPAPAELARTLTAVARELPFSTTCLDRSLALFRLLRRAGIPSTLQIGVARHEGTLAAHAWIEHEGKRLIDDDASEYIVFDTPITSSERAGGER